MDGASVSFPQTSVRRINIDAGDGNDVVANQTKLASTILGGNGNDKLTGGSGNDSIDAGAGNDTVNGEGGDDKFAGGDGNDVLEYGDRAAGFRFELAYFSPGAPENHVLLGSLHIWNSSESDTSNDFFETIGGTTFDDTFVPDIVSADHTITLLGRGGNDTFKRSSDTQPLVESGGPGNDVFEGYVGGGQTGNKHPPTLTGGAGNDLFKIIHLPASIDGGKGGNTIDLSESSNVFVVDLNSFRNVQNAINAYPVQKIIGTPGPNYMTVIAYGIGSPCTLLGNFYNDVLDGGDGDDLISGGGGNDKIYGGNGNDVINGNGGNDRIYGGAGNDTLIGGPGRDRLYGEAWNDFLNTRDNKIDTLYGGDGNDSGKIDNTSTVKDLYHEIEKLV
jgi:Ca2+-binding RTX toxin-like protein